MIDNELSGMNIEYEHSATVCKYVVSKGFPHPDKDMYMKINEKAIIDAGADLFYSCFAIDRNIYKPSPRGVAVTARGDRLNEANELCEKMLNENIQGDNIWHREDIGTEELLEMYKLGQK